MADIAAVFHWSPFAMDAMSVAELMRWRAKAERRVNPEKTAKYGKR